MERLGLDAVGIYECREALRSSSHPLVPRLVSICLPLSAIDESNLPPLVARSFMEPPATHQRLRTLEIVRDIPCSDDLEEALNCLGHGVFQQVVVVDESDDDLDSDDSDYEDDF